MSFKLVIGVMLTAVCIFVIFLVSFAYLGSIAAFFLAFLGAGTGLLFLIPKLVKAKEQNLINKFNEFSATLASDISEYRVFHSGHTEYWQPTDEEGIKRFLNAKYYRAGRSFSALYEIKTDEVLKHIYLATYPSRTKFDWNKLIHIEEWRKK